MFAPATQPPHRQQQKKPTEEAASAEEEALKWNTDCVYFLASPLTCKKGAECEYRHSEYARVNPRDCYYWLNGNCMNPKCGFRHPPLEGLLGNQGGAPAGPTQPSHANVQPSVAKQPVPCVFFQKGMCVKGDMCSFLHTPNPASYKRQPPVEAKPAADPQFSKKPFESSTEEKKSSDAKISKPVKSHADFAAAVAMSAGPRDTGGVEGYASKHLGYEPVPQRRGVGVSSFNEEGRSTQLLQKYGSDDNNSFHNGKEADDVLRESSPGFDVLVDNEPGNSEYYHVDDQYGRRSQEGGNSVNEYDPDFSAVADGNREAFRDQRFDPYDQRQAWGHRRVSSEKGDHLERRVYPEDKRSEHVRESDLRYRLSKQRKGNGTRSEVSHDYAPDSSVERGYRDSRRDRPRESSISSRRLQGRIKLPERSNGDEERRRDRSHASQERQGRLQDRIKSRLEDNTSGNEERGFRSPWERRREVEVERHSGFSAPKRAVEIKSAKEESKAEPILGKRKNTEEDQRHQRSGDSFAAPLPFSEILKRKRAAASGGSSNNKDETSQEPKSESLPKPEAGHDIKLITEQKPEVAEPNPTQEAEPEEGTVMEEVVAEEEEQAYEGNGEEEAYDQNGEYYYEEGYEEDGEYNYAEGEEEIGYAAEEGEEAMEGEEEEEGGDENAKKTIEMIS